MPEVRKLTCVAEHDIRETDPRTGQVLAMYRPGAVLLNVPKSLEDKLLASGYWELETEGKENAEAAE